VKDEGGREAAVMQTFILYYYYNTLGGEEWKDELKIWEPFVSYPI